MSHTAPVRLRQRPPAGLTTTGMANEQLSMRLLRHHTKNALQRVIAQIGNSDLRTTPSGNALADELERRIRLSARISDALFGLTTVPGPFPDRLGSVCRATADLMTDGIQGVELTTLVSHAPPPRLETTLLQLAQEMVANAVKHGLHMRLTGNVDVTLHLRRRDAAREELVLTVRDDGWGPDRAGFGEGMSLLELLAEEHGGWVILQRQEGWTICQITLPLPA